MTGPVRARPIGFAHRGGAANRRDQNTLAAFRLSLAMGATGIESDVALTGDGVPVLVHPGLVARLRRPVSRLVRADLPPHIPALEDVYAECGPGIDIALDMTAPAAVDKVVQLARRHGDTSRLWLTYWNVDTVARWRRLYPDVRLVFPTLLLRERHTARRVEQLRAAGVDAVNLFHRTCTPARVTSVQAQGLLVFGWGARTGLAARRVLANGVDGVFCDDTAGMVAALTAEVRRRAAVSGAR